MTDLKKQKIDQYLNEKGLNHLKTKSLYKKRYQKVIDIIELPFWSDERFAHLLTSCTFNASVDNISAILNLPYWNDPINLHFLAPSILAIGCDTLVSRIELYRSLLLLDFITPQSLKKTTEQIFAIYRYIVESNIGLVSCGKLHPLFSLAPTEMLRYYGVSLKWLVQRERERKK